MRIHLCSTAYNFQMPIVKFEFNTRKMNNWFDTIVIIFLNSFECVCVCVRYFFYFLHDRNRYARLLCISV